MSSSREAVDELFQHTLSLKIFFLHTGIVEYIDTYTGGTGEKKRPFCASSNILPSRDAVDDRFQHTYDVLAGIRMG